MKEKHINYFMSIAKETAKLSTARKLKVGCIIVKEDRIISIGYNGTPSGWDNDCEEMRLPEWTKTKGIHCDDILLYADLKTKPEVLHAEANAITKLARSSESGEGSSLFVTHTPCIECAKLIYQSGIREVYIGEDYSPTKGCGIRFLEQCDINIIK